MAIVIADRVQETTATTGTGTINLAGAATQYQTFIAAIGNGNTTYYCITSGNGTDWEVGLGTVTSGSPNTLSRTTILSSTNANAAISLSGTSTAFCTVPANALAPRVAIANNTSGSLQITAIPATFSAFDIVIQSLVPATSGASISMQFGSGATPTWETGSVYSQAWEKTSHGAGWAAGGSASSTAIDFAALALRAIGDAAGNFAGFSTRLLVTKANNKCYHVSGAIAAAVTSSNNMAAHVAGFFYNNVDITAVRIQASTGNWSTGSLAIVPLSI